MKKLLLALALLFSPSLASAQCTGVFGASTVCGATVQGTPRAIPFSAVLGNAITALTGDGTASGPGSVPLTLATVNSNVGTFGSATACVTATANAKGLITGISAATCTPAFSSLTGNIAVSQMNSGTGATSSTFWRGDGTWASTTGTISVDGRLTLESGFPVQSQNQRAKSTVYYTCYKGNAVGLPVAGVITAFTIPNCEISTGLAAANVLATAAYDVFVFSNAGTPTMCVNGNYWFAGSRTASTLTHGTNTIVKLSGLWVNNTAVTDCWGGAAGTTNYGSIASQGALWIGTIYASANGQTSLDTQPTAAAGGSGPNCGVFNAYNRVLTTCLARDATANWTHTSASAYTTCNSAGPGGGVGNRITFVDPLGDFQWKSETSFSIVSTSSTVGVFAIVGTGIDVTTAISGTANGGVYVQQITTPNPDPNTVANKYGLAVSGNFIPPNTQTYIGIHYLQCMQYANATSVEFNGSDYMIFSYTNNM